jgi:hypothetical protein
MLNYLSHSSKTGIYVRSSSSRRFNAKAQVTKWIQHTVVRFYGNILLMTTGPTGQNRKLTLASVTDN